MGCLTAVATCILVSVTFGFVSGRAGGLTTLSASHFAIQERCCIKMNTTRLELLAPLR